MRRFGDYASFFDFNLGYAGKSDPWSLAPVLKIVRTCDYVRRKEDARRLIFRLPLLWFTLHTPTWVYKGK